MKVVWIMILRNVNSKNKEMSSVSIGKTLQNINKKKRTLK